MFYTWANYKYVMLKLSYIVKPSDRKIFVGPNQVKWRHHRSGWKYAVSLFGRLHNPQGVLFNGFFDGFFYDANNRYRKPFVGVFHNTVWHEEKNPSLKEYEPKYTQRSLGHLLSTPQWEESKKHCKGIWVFSETVANELRSLVQCPVSFLYHPTDFNVPKFSIGNFLSNNRKTVLFIGHWMRDYRSLFLLKSGKYGKRLLVGGSVPADKHVIDSCAVEYPQENIPCGKVSDQVYDQLLRENICFISLFDASANNVVIECIVRTTPILINRLPAVVEYLGEEYPFYYADLEEAARKLQDEKLIKKTHEYLCVLPNKKFLSEDFFLRSVIKSEVYQGL